MTRLIRDIPYAYHNYNIAKADIFWEVQSNYINMRQLERKIPLMNSKVKATLENFEYIGCMFDYQWYYPEELVIIKTN